jgi:hypothetical protein
MASLQTLFGVTVPLSGGPIASPLAMALATRIGDAVKAMDETKVPVALAAEFRRDAERYLAVRRVRDLRLPPALERRCDDGARALMQRTANTPPQLRAGLPRMVA